MMNTKETHEKVAINTKITVAKWKIYMGIRLPGNIDCIGCCLVKAREKGVVKVIKRKATES